MSPGFARWSPAAPQRLWWQGPFGWLHKEFRDVDCQRPGKAIENFDGRVFILQLEATNVGAVDSPQSELMPSDSHIDNSLGILPIQEERKML
jgi:hypothetical protein